MAVEDAITLIACNPDLKTPIAKGGVVQPRYTNRNLNPGSHKHTENAQATQRDGSGNP